MRCCQNICFNSKLVRLEVRSAQRSYSHSGFNSKLVRLEGATGDSIVGATGVFQFQTGSIRRQVGSDIALGTGGVSIPNWFD